MGAHESVVDDAGVVRIGSVVFALIRPTPGNERAFNHWYERDHYYTAGLAAPGVFSAGRFIEPDSGWHLAIYFVLPGHDAARIAFATEQVKLAAADDRLFTEREHLHTWSYEVESTAIGADGVPPALALDHLYSTLAVAFLDGTVPDAASSATGGAVVVLRPRAQVMPSTWEGDIDLARRRTLLQFGPEPAAAPSGAVWSGSFVPAVFGTDTYVG